MELLRGGEKCCGEWGKNEGGSGFEGGNMKLTKKELAAQTGQTTSSLAVYIRRGKVLVGKDGLIDTNNAVNREFIATYAHKKVEKLPELTKAAKVMPIGVDVDDMMGGDDDGGDSGDDDGYVPGLHISEKKYKAALAEKTKKQDQLLEIQIATKRGQLIPSALVMPLFMQHNQHLLNEQRNADEEMLLMIAHKAGISDKDVAEIRGEWIKRRNKAVDDATALSENGLDQLIDAVIEKKK